MNKNLMRMYDNCIEIMRRIDGVLGAWNFGSEMHGLSDEHSDVDICFLIEGEKFHAIENSLSQILSEICDEIVLCWEESFNSNAIINNGYLLEKNNHIFQFDIFLLNDCFMDDFMCKIHYTDLNEKDIVFDNNGNVKRLCKNCPHGSVYSADLDYLVITYWYHAYMTAKYLIRHDYFKLADTVRTLYETHVSLLLTAYDTITWGGESNKIRFISENKQKHLKKYYCTDDFKLNRENLLQSFQWFDSDFNNLCHEKRNADYSFIGKKIMAFWINCTE